MEAGGAYGGGKAGGAFDMMQFIQKPIVILRCCCWVNVMLLTFQLNKQFDTVFGLISRDKWSRIRRNASTRD